MKLSISAFVVAALPLLASSASIGLNYKRGSLLEVTLSHVENAVVKATIKNVGHEDLNLLTSGTILDLAPVEKINVYTSNFTKLPFIGESVSLQKRNLSDASFISLAAGASLETLIDAAELYDFSGKPAPLVTRKATLAGNSIRTAQGTFVRYANGTLIKRVENKANSTSIHSKRSIEREGINGTAVEARSLNSTSVNVRSLNRHSERVLNQTSVVSRALNHTSILSRALNHTSILSRALNHTSILSRALNHTSIVSRALNHTSIVSRGLNHTSIVSRALNHTSIRTLNITSVTPRALNHASIRELNHSTIAARHINGSTLMLRSSNVTAVTSRALNNTVKRTTMDNSTKNVRVANTTSNAVYKLFNFVAEGTIAYARANSTKLSSNKLYFKSNTLALNIDVTTGN